MYTKPTRERYSLSPIIKLLANALYITRKIKIFIIINK